MYCIVLMYTDIVYYYYFADIQPGRYIPTGLTSYSLYIEQLQQHAYVYANTIGTDLQ